MRFNRSPKLATTGLMELLSQLDSGRRQGFRDKPDPRALAQRWHPDSGFKVIHHPALIPAEDLLHRDKQLGQIERNTRLFLSGRPANHALLWGARGTGKSSIIRATLTRHGGKELGMIELDREGLAALGDLIQILSNQDRKYILFIDDLSFEANDPSYKGLKALLDGSLMAPPDNVLVYASSNRRHLLPESMQDNLAAQVVDGELHEGDAIDEKVSLSERFGLWLAFHPFNQDQYLDIVRAQIQTIEGGSPEKTREIRDEERWQKEALMFARLRGSRSGRVAHQFVRYWLAENLADI